MHRRLIVLCLVVCACGDPVHDEAVAALGPEAPGVPHGPYHRPGQPCLVCHGGEGPASYTMSFGGTLRAYQSAALPATGATVRVVDASASTFETAANCVGNFWIRASDFSPSFPVSAAVTVSFANTPDTRSRVMLTQMHRDGSCNSCHAGLAGPASAGQLWVLPASDPAPAQDCGLGDGKGDMPGGAGVVPACPSPTPPATTPTYKKDVQPLLAKRCTGCHAADGEEADRPFTSHDDIAGSIGLTMANYVEGCRMPPPPLPQLTAAEQSILIAYIEAGAPDD
jgi:hypothetical protein